MNWPFEHAQPPPCHVPQPASSFLAVPSIAGVPPGAKICASVSFCGQVKMSEALVLAPFKSNTGSVMSKRAVVVGRLRVVVLAEEIFLAAEEMVVAVEEVLVLPVTGMKGRANGSESDITF